MNHKVIVANTLGVIVFIGLLIVHVILVPLDLFRDIDNYKGLEGYIWGIQEMIVSLPMLFFCGLASYRVAYLDIFRDRNSRFTGYEKIGNSVWLAGILIYNIVITAAIIILFSDDIYSPQNILLYIFELSFITNVFIFTIKYRNKKVVDYFKSRLLLLNNQLLSEENFNLIKAKNSFYDLSREASGNNIEPIKDKIEHLIQLSHDSAKVKSHKNIHDYIANISFDNINHELDTRYFGVLKEVLPIFLGLQFLALVGSIITTLIG